ncbi:hypothetical protein Tco_1487303 [Tanacetum coccineum]
MLSLRKLVLLNVSSLVKAKLNYRNAPDLLSDEENEEMLKEFILSLRHVKELTIGKYCQKVLSRLEAKGFTLITIRHQVSNSSRKRILWILPPRSLDGGEVNLIDGSLNLWLG